MKITHLEINNFRKLKNVSTEMNSLMLLVGKNNSGKTTFIEIFEKFFSDSKFNIRDFSKGLITRVIINNIYDEINETEKPIESEVYDELALKFPSIRLTLHLELEHDDDYSRIKPLIYEFDNNEKLTLVSEYKLTNVKQIIEKFKVYNNSLSRKKLQNKDFYDFFEDNYSHFYNLEFFTTKESSDTKSELIDPSVIKQLFNVHAIRARRDVDDTSEQNKQLISLTLWKFFIENKDSELSNEDLFSDALKIIKKSLDKEYTEIFNDTIQTIKKDILLNVDEFELSIISEIDIEKMLKANAKLRYKMDDLSLPESFNGLGISNLIYIFVEVMSYKLKIDKDNKPFNILFIEEPESHLHPQMQLTFYEKVKNLFKTMSNSNLLISTHSSYLLSVSDYLNIYYFYDSKKNILIKSLNNFIGKKSSEESNFDKFLKKYLKVATLDIFFADKVILFEGTAERLLIPAMMKKHDQNYKTNLCSQHISLFEVGGRYAHIFYELLNYLGIKSLIISDLDSTVDGKKATCNISKELIDNTKITKTSNGVIKDWFCMKGKDLYVVDLINFEKSKFIFFDKGREVRYLSTQLPTAQSFHCGRTLEEEIIIQNSNIFVKDFNDNFEHKDKEEFEYYEVCRLIKSNKKIDDLLVVANAFDYVDKLNKTDFALELIVNFDKWETPQYIEEGLKWLSK